MLVPLLEVFDLADTTGSCEQRARSTIPTQALTLLTSEFITQLAGFFAERVATEAGVARVQHAYQLAPFRAADEPELSAALAS